MNITLSLFFNILIRITLLNQNIVNAYPTIDVSSLDFGTYTVEFSSGQSRLVSQLLKH